MLTVGEILKKEREKKGYSLSHIEKKIRVRESFLKAIEANNWSTFSSKIYITGIIKNYARFLGIDPGRALAFFRRDYGRKEDISFKKAASSKHLVPESRQYAIAGLTFLILIFFTYFAFQLNLFLSPPKVTLLSPKTSQFKKQNRVKIVGKTEKDATITIFGERLYQNKEGIFEFNFPLHKGKNELVIEVVGANGRKAIYKKIYERTN